MTIQRRGFAPAEKELNVKHSDTVTIPFKGKEVRIVLTGEFPMFNVADINAIVGKGKLENAVKRAMKKSWIEVDEAGLKTTHFPKFEEMGTPPSVGNRVMRALSSCPTGRCQTTIPRKSSGDRWILNSPIGYRIYVIDRLYMFLYDQEKNFTFSVPCPFQEVANLRESPFGIKRH